MSKDIAYAFLGITAAYLFLDGVGNGDQSIVGRASATLTSAVRGIRNNNPGNIMHGQSWQGLSAVQTDSVFDQFDSMFYGLRALSKNLQSYYRRGLNTISSVISVWTATDRATYIANVSELLGVDPDAHIDVSDVGIRAGLMRAIILQENGVIASALITDAAIFEGANAS